MAKIIDFGERVTAKYGAENIETVTVVDVPDEGWWARSSWPARAALVVAIAAAAAIATYLAWRLVARLIAARKQRALVATTPTQVHVVPLPVQAQADRTDEVLAAIHALRAKGAQVTRETQVVHHRHQADLEPVLRKLDQVIAQTKQPPPVRPQVDPRQVAAQVAAQLPRPAAPQLPNPAEFAAQVAAHMAAPPPPALDVQRLAQAIAPAIMPAVYEGAQRAYAAGRQDGQAAHLARAREKAAAKKKGMTVEQYRLAKQRRGR